GHGNVGGPDSGVGPSSDPAAGPERPPARHGRGGRCVAEGWYLGIDDRGRSRHHRQAGGDHRRIGGELGDDPNNTTAAFGDNSGRRGELAQALPVASDEKGALSIGRRRKGERRSSWRAEWSIPSRGTGAYRSWRSADGA